MRDDEKLEITAGRVRKLAERYGGLKIAFPEAFEPEWETIKGLTISPGGCDGGGFYISVFDNSVHIATIWADGNASIYKPNVRYHPSNDLFTFERKVSPCPK